MPQVVVFKWVSKLTNRHGACLRNSRPQRLNLYRGRIVVRRLGQFLILVLVAAVSASACSSANPSGPSATSSGAVINGALVSESGTATKHSASGAGSATVPGLVVSVAGTAISAAVDSADQFVLRDVPAGTLQLVFTAPGLNGSISLADVQAGDTVDIGVMVSGGTVVLDSNSRRRGSDTELEGRIEALPPTTAAGTFIVAGRHVTTTDATRFFFRGDEPATFADLEVGMRVHVKGQRNGNTLMAAIVRMQNPKVDLPVNLNGIVEDLTGTLAAFQFTVDGRQVKGDADTTWQGNSRFSDLANGKRVEVKGEPKNGYVYALRIHVNK